MLVPTFFFTIFNHNSIRRGIAYEMPPTSSCRNFVAERRHSSVTRHAERSQRAGAQRISSHKRAGGTPLQMRRSAYLCQRRLPISRGTGTIGLEYINVFNNIPLTENLQNQTKIRINWQISTPIQIRANYRANIKC